MTKKELIEMLSEVPEDAVIYITKDYQDLISSYTRTSEINGFYKYREGYILSELNVIPRKHD
jgi:hypothetical protein